MFYGTIKMNIALGDSSVTEEMVHNAAIAAKADTFIMKLPDKYDTQVRDHACFRLFVCLGFRLF